MRIIKTRHFDRWAKKLGLTDAALVNAVVEINNGLVDVNLGGSLVKKRVAVSGKGKSAGARTIVATNFGESCYFIHGFEKSTQANISPSELEALKALATDLLAMSEQNLDALLAEERMMEVKSEG
jgi:hypothetical protein